MSGPSNNGQFQQPAACSHPIPASDAHTAAGKALSGLYTWMGDQEDHKLALTAQLKLLHAHQSMQAQQLGAIQARQFNQMQQIEDLRALQFSQGQQMKHLSSAIEVLRELQADYIKENSAKASCDQRRIGRAQSAPLLVPSDEIVDVVRPGAKQWQLGQQRGQPAQIEYPSHNVEGHGHSNVCRAPYAPHALQVIGGPPAQMNQNSQWTPHPGLLPAWPYIDEAHGSRLGPANVHNNLGDPRAPIALGEQSVAGRMFPSYGTLTTESSISGLAGLQNRPISGVTTTMMASPKRKQPTKARRPAAAKSATKANAADNKMTTATTKAVAGQKRKPRAEASTGQGSRIKRTAIRADSAALIECEPLVNAVSASAAAIKAAAAPSTQVTVEQQHQDKQQQRQPQQQLLSAECNTPYNGLNHLTAQQQHDHAGVCAHAAVLESKDDSAGYAGDIDASDLVMPSVESD